MSWIESEKERNERWNREDKEREIEYDDFLDDADDSDGSSGGYGGGSYVGSSKGGCIAIVIITLIILLLIISNSRHNEIQEKYSSNAISNAKTIELNKEYKEKTYMNRMSPDIFRNLRKWKGYSFVLNAGGTVDIEYYCKKMRHGNGPNWVRWQLVDKETGEILQETPSTGYDHEPFHLNAGEYVLEFSSCSNEFGFDGRRRPFTFTVNYLSDDY